MKNVTVKVHIQFDVVNDDPDKIKAEVMDKLDSMSQTLATYHTDSDPLIFTNSIDSSDIDIHTPEDEMENPMCKKYTDAEALPDDDDNCSLCGGDCVDQ